MPALGVAPLEPQPVVDRVVLSDSSMTNRHLAVRWDSNGNITSIIDLAHAREIVPVGSLSAVLELAVDHPVEYDAWDLESWTRAGARPVTDSTEVTIVDSCTSAATRDSPSESPTWWAMSWISGTW